jgi:hypothetical protein
MSAVSVLVIAPVLVPVVVVEFALEAVVLCELQVLLSLCLEELEQVLLSHDQPEVQLAQVLPWPGLQEAEDQQLLPFRQETQLAIRLLVRGLALPSLLRPALSVELVQGVTLDW